MPALNKIKLDFSLRVMSVIRLTSYAINGNITLQVAKKSFDYM